MLWRVEQPQALAHSSHDGRTQVEICHTNRARACHSHGCSIGTAACAVWRGAVAPWFGPPRAGRRPQRHMAAAIGLRTVACILCGRYCIDRSTVTSEADHGLGHDASRQPRDGWAPAQSKLQVNGHDNAFQHQTEKVQAAGLLAQVNPQARLLHSPGPRNRALYSCA